MRPSRRLELLTLAVFAVGNGCCALPREVVRAPELEVRVVAGGKPIENAEVRTFHWSNPHHHLDDERSAATDAAGKAAFTKQVDTEVVLPLCMHGVPEHHVTVCVAKPGHATVLFELDDPGAATTVDVELRSGPSRACDWASVARASGSARADLSATPNVLRPAELAPATTTGTATGTATAAAASTAGTPSASGR
jgi:hypothetical protein